MDDKPVGREFDDWAGERQRNPSSSTTFQPPSFNLDAVKARSAAGVHALERSRFNCT